MLWLCIVFFHRVTRQPEMVKRLFIASEVFLEDPEDQRCTCELSTISATGEETSTQLPILAYNSLIVRQSRLTTFNADLRLLLSSWLALMLSSSAAAVKKNAGFLMFLNSFSSTLFVLMRRRFLHSSILWRCISCSAYTILPDTVRELFLQLNKLMDSQRWRSVVLS